MRNSATKAVISDKGIDSVKRMLTKHIKAKYMKYVLIKHIKNRRGIYIGTFVAVPINDKEVAVAWSKCHRIDLEKNRIDRISSRKKGLQIAINRVIYGTKVPIALALRDRMSDFLNDITRYYQDKAVITPIGMIAEDRDATGS